MQCVSNRRKESFKQKKYFGVRCTLRDTILRIIFMLMTLSSTDVSFKLGSDDLLSSAKSSVEICVQEINNWMIFNGLKLNEEKTELLLLSSRYRPSPSFVLEGKLFNRPLLFVILE